MLLVAGDQEGLEQYALEKAGQSKELDRWWGTLLASRGDIPEAMAVYEAAQDTLSQVQYRVANSPWRVMSMHLSRPGSAGEPLVHTHVQHALVTGMHACTGPASL